jgi:MFS family permease
LTSGSYLASQKISGPKPCFYYGYVIVIATFIMMVLGWGMFFIYGVFFRPLMDDFNWTRAVTSGAFSMSVLVSGIVGIIAGRLSDRVGPKIVILFCTALLTLGYMLMALVQSTWQFYFLYGIVIASGVGGFWAPQVSTVARWFIGRRGMMTGIVSGGISFGTLVLPLIVTPLLDAYEWRTTYFIIGIAIFFIVGIAAQFIKPSPQKMGLLPYTNAKSRILSSVQSSSFTFKEAVLTHQFWMVAVIYFFFGVAQLTVMVHMVPQATGMGISAINAAGILSVVGGVSLAGRIIMGLVSDRVPVKISAILSLVLMLVAFIWLQQADSLWKLYVFAVFFGFGYGGLSCLQSLIAAELFGLVSLGMLTGIFSLSFNIGGAIGPVLAGFVFDINDSYTWAFIGCLISIIVALGICLLLKPPKKKVDTDL